MIEKIESTDDRRIENNDPMRKNYRVLTDDEKRHMTTFKIMGEEFLEKCDHTGQSRELSLAKTKMEEAVMWAVKHVTR